MIYLLYIIFGLAPSIIWLLFFLRKDVHPEPKKMILNVFFWGILITVPVLLIEMLVASNLKKLNLPSALTSLLYWFIGVAFVEEFFKYLVVRSKVLNNPEFDEPVDAMLYMIIAALGFAAIENIFYLIPNGPPLPFFKIISQTITTSSIRFLGAVFLHALCSGVVGYFLALSFFKPKKHNRLIILGLAIATLLHGLFNFSIMKIEQSYYLILIPIVILISLVFFVSFGFKKLKNIASICRLK